MSLSRTSLPKTVKPKNVISSEALVGKIGSDRIGFREGWTLIVLNSSLLRIAAVIPALGMY